MSVDNEGNYVAFLLLPLSQGKRLQVLTLAKEFTFLPVTPSKLSSVSSFDATSYNAILLLVNFLDTHCDMSTFR